MHGFMLAGIYFPPLTDWLVKSDPVGSTFDRGLVPSVASLQLGGEKRRIVLGGFKDSLAIGCLIFSSKVSFRSPLPAYLVDDERRFPKAGYWLMVEVSFSLFWSEFVSSASRRILLIVDFNFSADMSCLSWNVQALGQRETSRAFLISSQTTN
ncbi:hypothetical protein V6N11_035339 [Hibiscus sabdariffa]|uniref:Uncharacterized protein n=1 Tax=Hibiscus sabdariffa TaxID=183260 RepID=A0ABR2R040_9ROSI